MTFVSAAGPKAKKKNATWHVARRDRHTVCGRSTEGMQQAAAVPQGGRLCGSCDMMKESMARELLP